MTDEQMRAALERHWAASDANDLETEHSLYHEDAVLEYPQSGERINWIIASNSSLSCGIGGH